MRGLFAGLGVIVGGIVVALAIASVLVIFDPASANGANDATPPDMAQPALGSAPARERQDLLREQRARLSGEGVDPATGERHIPIERAMRQRATTAALPLDAPFVDADGRHVALGGDFGRVPVIVVLGYSRCRDLCPVTLDGITQALDRAGLVPERDYLAVFASLDADETPLALAAMRASRIPAADRGAWRFLSGDERSIERLSHALDVRIGKAGDGTFAHTAGFVVADRDGSIAHRFGGVRFDPAEVRDAIERPASGNALERVARLVCSHFDPAIGRYDSVVVDALRAMSTTFFVALGFAVWNRRRRAR